MIQKVARDAWDHYAMPRVQKITETVQLFIVWRIIQPILTDFMTSFLFSHCHFDWPIRLRAKHIGIKIASDFVCPKGNIAVHGENFIYLFFIFLPRLQEYHKRAMDFQVPASSILINDLLMFGVAAAAMLVQTKTLKSDWKKRADFQMFPLEFPVSAMISGQRFAGATYGAITQIRAFCTSHARFKLWTH